MKAPKNPLEPLPENFAARDAAGLCVACGKNPQPPRRDSGDSPTHHRCDDCWPHYQQLKNLRDRILDGEGWMLTTTGKARSCELCGEAIAYNEYSILTTRGIDSCFYCVEACGFNEALQAHGGDAPPLLQGAAVKVKTITDSLSEAERDTLARWSTLSSQSSPAGVCSNFLTFVFPPAMAVMTGLAVHLLRGFLEDGIQCVCGPEHRATGFRVTVVEAGSPKQRPDVPALVSATTLQLVRFCTGVEVPRKFYQSARGKVYDTVGNPLARRVKRARVE